MLYDFLITAFKVIAGVLSSGGLTAFMLIFIFIYVGWVCLALVFSFQYKFYKNALKLYNYINTTEKKSIRLEVLDSHIKTISRGFWYGWNKFKNAKSGKPSDYIKRDEVLEIEINGGIQNQGKSFMKAYINFVVILLSLLSLSYYGASQTLTLSVFAESLVAPLFTFLILRVFYFVYTTVKQQLYKNDTEAYYELIDILDSKVGKEYSQVNETPVEEETSEENPYEDKFNMKNEFKKFEDDVYFAYEKETEDLEKSEEKIETNTEINSDENLFEPENSTEPENSSEPKISIQIEESKKIDIPSNSEELLDAYDIFKKKNIDVSKIMNEIPSASSSTPYIDVDSDYVIKDDEKENPYPQRSFNGANNGSDILGGMLQNTQGTKKSTFVNLEKPIATIDEEKVEKLENKLTEQKKVNSKKNGKSSENVDPAILLSDEEKQTNFEMNDSIFNSQSSSDLTQEQKNNESAPKKLKVEVNFNNSSKGKKSEEKGIEDSPKENDKEKIEETAEKNDVDSKENHENNESNEEVKSNSENVLLAENSNTSENEINSLESSDENNQTTANENSVELEENLNKSEIKTEINVDPVIESEQVSEQTSEQNPEPAQEKTQQPNVILPPDPSDENLGVTTVVGRFKRNNSKLANGGIEIIRNDDPSRLSGGEINQKSSKQIEEISNNSKNIETINVKEPDSSIVETYGTTSRRSNNLSSRPDIEYNDPSYDPKLNPVIENYNSQDEIVNYDMNYTGEYSDGVQNSYIDPNYDMQNYNAMPASFVNNVDPNFYNQQYVQYNNYNQNEFSQDYESDYQPMGPINLNDDMDGDESNPGEDYVDEVFSRTKKSPQAKNSKPKTTQKSKNSSKQVAKSKTVKTTNTVKATNTTKSRNKSIGDEEDMGKRGRPKNQVIDEAYVIKDDKEFDEVLSRAEKLMRKSDEGLSQSQSKRIEKELKTLMDAMNRYKEKK